MATPRPAMRPDAARLVIGIDGGGTKTVCQIAAASPGFPAAEGAAGRGEVSLLGSARGGPSNPRAIGLEAACAAIDATISAAFESAGLERATAAACVLGLAGAGDAATQQAITAWGEKRSTAARIRVVPDYELVLAAGTPAGIGLGLIAGTGSLAFGRNSRGETARAGGWGYLLGDEGGGFAIGRAAVRRVLSAADREEPERPLHHLVSQQLSAHSPAEIVAAVYSSSNPRAALASVALPVVAAAEEGDPLAQEIVGEAAGGLAGLVRTVAQRLRMVEPPMPLALAGGILLGSPVVRLALRDVLESTGMGDVIADFTLVPDPVAGAVRLALREAL